MDNIGIPWLIILVGIFTLFVYILVVALLKVVKQVTETNKQLLIVVAGKEPKPESALRALVASNKPPQGKLRGIAGDKKKVDKPKNTDYTMTAGVK